MQINHAKMFLAAFISARAINLAISGLSIVGLTIISVVTVSAPARAVEPHEYAVRSELIDKALVLAVADLGDRLVAVGQFGHILFSDDVGVSWTQVQNVPTRNTLTNVNFLNNKVGFAVGYEATILKTTDGGGSWVLKNLERRGEDPLFGIHFIDEKNGLAVGAFSTMLETTDGGESWRSRVLVEDSYDDFHLNDLIADRKGGVFIPAEFGTVYRSLDGGNSFEPIQTPYDGSFWGGMVLQTDALLIWGMRGNAFISTDSGTSWQKANTNNDRSITGGIQLADGRVVLTGLSGLVLVSQDNGSNFKPTIREGRRNFAAISRGTDDDTVTIYGDPGVLAHTLQ